MRSKFIVILLVGLVTALFACQQGQVEVTESTETPADTTTTRPRRQSANIPVDTTTPADTTRSPSRVDLDPTSAEITPSPVKVRAEDVINRALTQLPEGQVYHNVPEQMQVGVSETIEAGIAPEVTEKIKKELQGKGVIHTESGVAYDPSGVEMKLVVNKDEFDVLEVRSGKQFVTAKTPGKWIWQVTPLKSGDNLIIVKAIVELNVPELKVTRPVEVEVFKATRKVDVNFGYSVSEFVSTNWKEVLGLVVGSSSVAGLVTWWIGRNDRKTKES